MSPCLCVFAPLSLAARFGILVARICAMPPRWSMQCKCLRWHVCRTDFAQELFLNYEFSYEKCSGIAPKCFDPLSGGSEKSPQNSSYISQRKKKKKTKNHRRASAGAQGERMSLSHPQPWRRVKVFCWRCENPLACS